MRINVRLKDRISEEETFGRTDLRDKAFSEANEDVSVLDSPGLRSA